MVVLEKLACCVMRDTFFSGTCELDVRCDEMRWDGVGFVGELGGRATSVGIARWLFLHGLERILR